MARIFIYDKSYDTINALRHALECQANCHEVFANLVLPKGETVTKLVLSPVDVVGLLVNTLAFPDVVIAEACEADGGWLCGLIYDMELGQNCSVILTGHHHTQKIKHLQKLYGAQFWPKPFNVMHFVEYIETFLAVSC